jgi:hypothetical protein
MRLPPSVAATLPPMRARIYITGNARRLALVVEVAFAFRSDRLCPAPHSGNARLMPEAVRRCPCRRRCRCFTHYVVIPSVARDLLWFSPSPLSLSFAVALAVRRCRCFTHYVVIPSVARDLLSVLALAFVFAVRRCRSPLWRRRFACALTNDPSQTLGPCSRHPRFCPPCRSALLRAASMR